MAFRGDKEDIHFQKNPGNFLALLNIFAETDSVLHACPSAQIQMISFVLVLPEVKKVRFFSVLADKVSSHSVEHLALCLRFVNRSVIFKRTS